ncbi:hypothetical protein ACRAWF_01840 [Streptomyces sp. L7]
MSDKPNWSVDGSDGGPTARPAASSRPRACAGHVQIMGEGRSRCRRTAREPRPIPARSRAAARQVTSPSPRRTAPATASPPRRPVRGGSSLRRHVARSRWPCEKLAIAPEIAIGHSAGAAILTCMTPRWPDHAEADRQPQRRLSAVRRAGRAVPLAARQDDGAQPPGAAAVRLAGPGPGGGASAA